MTAIETVNTALSLARDRLNDAPTFQLFASIVTQLEYVLNVLSGKESDKSQMKKIIVGHYAVREFEESDPELANALIAVQSIASKISKGLKV
jgi:predicted transcriptional regulator